MKPDHTCDQVVLRFVQEVARVRAIFRDIHIELERLPQIRQVFTTVSPIETEQSKSVSLDFFCDAELVAPVDSDHQSFGVSLRLQLTQGGWLTIGEIGWSGAAIGWDHFIERTMESSSTLLLTDKLLEFVAELANEFRQEVMKAFGD